MHTNINQPTIRCIVLFKQHRDANITVTLLQYGTGFTFARDRAHSIAIHMTFRGELVANTFQLLGPPRPLPFCQPLALSRDDSAAPRSPVRPAGADFVAPTRTPVARHGADLPGGTVPVATGVVGAPVLDRAPGLLREVPATHALLPAVLGDSGEPPRPSFVTVYVTRSRACGCLGR